MKRLELISVALVAIIALTVVSGAGAITVSATNGYVAPTVTWTVTQNGNAVDPMQPVQIGVPVVAHFSIINNDPTLLMDFDIAPASQQWFALTGGITSLSAMYSALPDAPLGKGVIGEFQVVFGGPGIFANANGWTWTLHTAGGQQAATGYVERSVSVFAAGLTKNSALSDLSSFRTWIDHAGDTSLYPSAAIRLALFAIVDGATLQTTSSKYSSAAYTLQSKFIPRVDGTTLRGTPDTINGGTLDYIRGLDSVGPYILAVGLVNELNWLQAHPS